VPEGTAPFFVKDRITFLRDKISDVGFCRINYNCMEKIERKRRKTKMEWIKWAFIILGMYIVSEVIIRVFIPRLKGASGEATVSVLLKRLPENEYKVLHNVMLRTDRGMSQVDHVVVSVYGIFVIEVKNYTGWITGSEWRTASREEWEVWEVSGMQQLSEMQIYAESIT
jgi:hypothetical protein